MQNKINNVCFVEHLEYEKLCNMVQYRTTQGAERQVKKCTK